MRLSWLKGLGFRVEGLGCRVTYVCVSFTYTWHARLPLQGRARTVFRHSDEKQAVSSRNTGFVHETVFVHRV